MCTVDNHPLLARGRDRLETGKLILFKVPVTLFPYSLGDAIDWKPTNGSNTANMFLDPLLARGRDRLETKLQSILVVTV